MTMTDSFELSGSVLFSSKVRSRRACGVRTETAISNPAALLQRSLAGSATVFGRISSLQPESNSAVH